MDLGYVSAFTEEEILQPLHCFSGITASFEQDTYFLFITSHVSVGEPSPHLSAADNILVAGSDWFSADPSPAFAVVLPHSQLPWEWPMSPE